jgi:hypothetical protein
MPSWLILDTMNTENALTLYGVGVETSFLLNDDILNSIVKNMHYLVGNTNPPTPSIHSTATGKSVFSASASLQSILTTFPQKGSFLIQFHSDPAMDLYSLRQKLASTLCVSLGNISMKENIKSLNVECQETECRAHATERWYGRKICQDHYEQYEDKKADDIESDSHLN